MPEMQVTTIQKDKSIMNNPNSEDLLDKYPESKYLSIGLVEKEDYYKW